MENCEDIRDRGLLKKPKDGKLARLSASFYLIVICGWGGRGGRTNPEGDDSDW